MDQHWRPQAYACPFCLLDFSVYSRLEELDQDALYFFTHANLTNRVNYKKKLNSVNDLSSERRFWSQVGSEFVKQLSSSWAYQIDFQMFEYNIEDYLERLGISL